MDTNGEFHIEASHHDGSAYLDVRLISGVSYDAKGFKLGGEYYAPGKMDLVDFYILLDNLYDSPDVGPCSLPRFSERAYGTARESYRFRETTFDIYQVADSLDRPYMVKISTGEGACKDAGLRFASVGEAKAWCHRYSLRELAEDEKSVKKHRNDVCRLATLLAGGERPAMSEGVRADMRRFLEAYESDPVDPKALKIKGVGAQQVVEVLKSVYLR